MEELRPLLFTYAYNLLGIAEEAEDIVQDAFLKFSQLDQQQVLNKRAYLVRMVINMSISRKRKMRSETVSYYGEWLPEPVATDRADSRVISKDILSWSLMVLLEKLSARERAVFILKEAYGYEHTQIASVLGISSDLSRQLLTRGRKHLKAAKLTDPVQHQHEAGDALPKFMQAIYNSDMKKLEELLHEDIMISVDGGGKVKASKNNIYGRKHAAVLLFGLYHKFWFVYRIEIAEINHSPAILYFENDSLAACEICEYEEGGTLSRVDIVRNPDKLSSLEKNFQLLSQ